MSCIELFDLILAVANTAYDPNLDEYPKKYFQNKKKEEKISLFDLQNKKTPKILCYPLNFAFAFS